MRNSLLKRRQFIIDVLHPGRANVSKQDLKVRYDGAFGGGLHNIGAFGGGLHNIAASACCTTLELAMRLEAILLILANIRSRPCIQSPSPNPAPPFLYKPRQKWHNVIRRVRDLLAS